MSRVPYLSHSGISQPAKLICDPLPNAASNAGVIAATTLGSIVGLVAMVLLLIFILRRRRDTEEEIANEIK